jgi:membrane-bound lytic murein transglycosylase D
MNFTMLRIGCKKAIQLIITIYSCVLVHASFAYPNLEGIQIYQKNIHLFPERKQSLADDIDRYRNANDLWSVLRQEFVLNHHEDDPIVQAQIEWFMQHQDFLLNSAERASPYLYYILQQTRKRNLPVELVLLPMIESAFNPFAYSPAGASGIWQMMPDTATGYGIHADWWYDGRRDVITSTKAALNYLSYLGSFFDNNWFLALAAYDTGEGNVLSAIKRNIRDGYNTDFWSLPLAQETRDYVPRLLALAEIIAHPERYPVYFPPVHNAPYLAQIDIGKQIDLKHAAYLAGLSMKKLMQLNPGFNHATTSPNGPHKLVLPIENVGQFSENLVMLPSYLRTGRDFYRVKSGDTLRTIASQFHSTASSLRKLNQLASNHVATGKNILVPHTTVSPTRIILASSRQQPSFVSHDPDAANIPRVRPKNTKEALMLASQEAESSRNKLIQALKSIGTHYVIQPGDTIYMTRRGDNLDRIAKQFNVSKTALLASNPIDSRKSLHSGVRLVIPTHSLKSQIASNDQKYSLPSYTW